MNTSFEAAIKVVLRHEGGWVSDPKDLGGETNFGISTLIIQREGITNAQLGLPVGNPVIDGRAPGWLQTMKVEAAERIYRQLFWDRYGYAGIADQLVATKVFDCAVNCGPSRAHAMAQRAAAQCGAPCDVDGILGPDTFKAINASEPRAFVTAFAAEMRAHYERIIIARPANEKFRSNWMRRAAWGT